MSEWTGTPDGAVVTGVVSLGGAPSVSADERSHWYLPGLECSERECVAAVPTLVVGYDTPIAEGAHVVAGYADPSLPVFYDWSGELDPIVTVGGDVVVTYALLAEETHGFLPRHTLVGINTTQVRGEPARLFLAGVFAAVAATSLVELILWGTRRVRRAVR